MKTLPVCVLTFVAALATFGCDSKAVQALSTVASNPNSPVSQAVSSVTTAMFEAEQPVLNAAVSSLPVDVQALAQLAYVALEKAVTGAEQQGLRLFAVDGNLLTQSVGSDLASVRDALHSVIHDPNAPMANPNDVIQDPNLAAIPTVTMPATPAIP